ncbi:MAG: hypothetical protein SFU25_04505 [Candidatus Caenarcaniphilales bacterium]|nr:hypothetical protein [Candidatus Caenarcaniphilales bacterium]
MNSDEEELIKLAKEASKGSFSQMSGFAVGAAVLVEDTKGWKHMVKGSNYETQNYRSVCAEKHALQSAHVDYSEEGKSPKYMAIAIYSPNSYEPIFPCGDCRQALFEQNPKMKVICIGAGGAKKEFIAEELLPNGFRLDNNSGNNEKLDSKILDYIVHYPVFQNKLSMLRGLEKLIVVGSPRRAAKLAKEFVQLDELSHEWGGAIAHCYCHIGNHDTDREYSLFILEWPEHKIAGQSFKVGIASHGIGASGIEIVLSELNALIALSENLKVENLKGENLKGSKSLPLKAVIRSGTRGTIDDVALGTIAITSEAFSETSSSKPDLELTKALINSAKELAIPVEEGACLSAQFFWSGQGRTAFPLIKQEYELEPEHDKYLRSLKTKGIRWIEMEDYYLNYFAQKYGFAAAALGVVVARRYDARTDKFVLDYDAKSKKNFELMPARVALQALYTFAKDK